MNTIKAGDWVKCINWKGYSFTAGKIYKVVKEKVIADNFGRDFRIVSSEHNFQKFIRPLTDIVKELKEAGERDGMQISLEIAPKIGTVGKFQHNQNDETSWEISHLEDAEAFEDYSEELEEGETPYMASSGEWYRYFTPLTKEEVIKEIFGNQ